MSNRHLGIKASKATLKKMRDAKIGRKLSEEHKQNLRGKIHKPDCRCVGCRVRRGECKGENHPNWKGGISSIPYPIEWTDTLKESIRQRDNHTCQLCGKDKIANKENFSVHHIDYNKENLDPKNLITLCRSCNAKVNFKRSCWKKVFELKLKVIA